MYGLCNVCERNTHEDGEETQKAHQGLWSGPSHHSSLME